MNEPMEPQVNSPAQCSQPTSTAVATSLHGGRVTSDLLLGLRNELEIVHDGFVYRLRKTANGKLILTK